MEETSGSKGKTVASVDQCQNQKSFEDDIHVQDGIDDDEAIVDKNTAGGGTTTTTEGKKKKDGGGGVWDTTNKVLG